MKTVSMTCIVAVAAVLAACGKSPAPEATPVAAAPAAPTPPAEIVIPGERIIPESLTSTSDGTVIGFGEVYARGAQDNKGQCISVLAAVRHLLKRDGRLPVNVKLIIEGEEETGSRGLVGLLQSQAQRMKADYLMVVDMGIPGPGIPSLTLGLRGIASMTLELEGSNTDLHSGVYGGIVYNPNRALVEILAKLHDASGRVASARRMRSRAGCRAIRRPLHGGRYDAEAVCDGGARDP